MKNAFTSQNNQEAMTMADLLANFQPVMPKRNSLIEGEIIGITREGALVHTGAKSESLIPADEVAELGLSVGQKGAFFVIGQPDENGSAMLSLKAARGWNELKAALESNTTVDATIKSLVKRGDRIAGAIASVCGLRGFIPAFQLGCRLNEAATLVGETTPVKVLKAEPNEDRNEIILSRRAILDEQQASFFANAHVGQIVSGVVRAFGVKKAGDCDVVFGAFVDIGCGLSGLVHRSEISHDRKASPDEVVSIGQELELVITDINEKDRKIGLSLKQAAQLRKIQSFSRGQVIVGKVARKTEYGAFIDLGGMDGLLHVSDIPGGLRNPAEALAKLAIGSELTVTVIKVKPESGRVGLSLTPVQS